MQADRPGQGSKLKRCRHVSETPRDKEPRRRQDHRDFQYEAEMPVGGKIGAHEIEDDHSKPEPGRHFRRQNDFQRAPVWQIANKDQDAETVAEQIDARLRAAIPEIARIAKESVADGRRRGQGI